MRYQQHSRCRHLECEAACSASPRKTTRAAARWRGVRGPSRNFGPRSAFCSSSSFFSQASIVVAPLASKRSYSRNVMIGTSRPLSAQRPDETGPRKRRSPLNQSGLPTWPNYTSVTFSAHGPFGPRPSVYVTFWPSCSWSKVTPWRLFEWKNRSFAPPVLMNPKPLSVNFLMLPSAICTTSA